MNFNPISITTGGSLIIFGKMIKSINLKDTVWEKLILTWLNFKYDVKAIIGFKNMYNPITKKWNH